MTTYTLTGVAVHRNTNGNDDVVGITQNIQLQIVVEDGVTSFSYSLLPLEPGDDTRNADISIDDYNARVTGSFGTVNLSDADDSFLLDINSSASGAATVLGFYQENQFVNGLGNVDTDFLFVIDGSVPSISTVGQWNAFESTLTSVNEASGSFGPGVNIPLNGLGATVSQNDLIIGTEGDDTLNGGLGNDTILGLGGIDFISGGDGNDSLNPGDSNDYDVVNAGAGNDTIDLGDAVNGFVDIGHWGMNGGFTANFNGVNGTLNFDKGANGTTTVLDVLTPVLNDNTGGLGISGTDHDDTFNITRANGGFMQVRGDAGDDTFNIFAGGGGTVRLDYRQSNLNAGIDANLATGIIIDSFGDTDTLGGSDFFTDLRATMFADNIVGSDRDERFISMGGDDTVDGGGGVDMIRYDRSGVSAVTVNLNTGIATGIWERDGIVSNFTDTLMNIEQIRASREGDDLLIGNAADNRFRGNGGDDTLFGNAGDDRLEGNDGNDLLGGGQGNDELYGDAGNDALYTAAGDDRAFGGTGNDTLGGAGGNDELHGEEGNDQLWGAVGDDTLFGGEGDDTLGGSVGDDELHGNDGNDEMWGSDGNDELYGGEGNDTLGGSVGNDTLSGEGGNDELWGADGIDDLNGGDGDDRIGAGAGDDVVLGGFGNDQMFGGLGNDFLGGNDGNDTIYGAAGDDTINGNGGDDEMYAGPGFDEIQFSTGDDIVFFFSTADDVVNLSFASGITSFSDLQNNHLSEVGGSAVITDDNGDTLTLNGVTAGSLALDDFIF